MNSFLNKYTLAGLPVVVMLAMAPLSTDGKQPAQFVPINSEQLTELVAQANAIAPKAYEYAQSPEKTALPYSMKYLDSKRIHESIKCTGNKQPGYLVLTSTKAFSKGNSIRDIYFVEAGHTSTDINEAPPRIVALIYHDIGENEFIGIKTREGFYDKDHNVRVMDKEIKLDNESAQYLINFLAGETKYTNNTGIEFKTTENSKVSPPKVY